MLLLKLSDTQARTFGASPEVGRHPTFRRSPMAMNERPSTADIPIAHVVPPPVKAAEPTLKAASKVQDWHRAQIVIAGFLALAAVAFLLAMVTIYSKPSPTTNEMLGGKLNTGKIISYSGPDKECRQQVFDNKTGQMTKPSPCDLNALGNSSPAASANSGNRLESISKAFSGR
jgi:hypothetical protein